MFLSQETNTRKQYRKPNILRKKSKRVLNPAVRETEPLQPYLQNAKTSIIGHAVHLNNGEEMGANIVQSTVPDTNDSNSLGTVLTSTLNDVDSNTLIFCSEATTLSNCLQQDCTEINSVVNELNNECNVKECNTSKAKKKQKKKLNNNNVVITVLLKDDQIPEEPLASCSQCGAAPQSAHAAVCSSPHYDACPAPALACPAPALACPAPGCARRFRQPCRLREHMRAHTGDRPYPCLYENCGQSFRSASKLLRHKVSHTGERRHVCASCSRAYKRADHLREHLARHRLTGCTPDGRNRKLIVKVDKTPKVDDYIIASNNTSAVEEDENIPTNTDVSKEDSITSDLLEAIGPSRTDEMNTELNAMNTELNEMNSELDEMNTELNEMHVIDSTNMLLVGYIAQPLTLDVDLGLNNELAVESVPETVTFHIQEDEDVDNLKVKVEADEPYESRDEASVEASGEADGEAGGEMSSEAGGSWRAARTHCPWPLPRAAPEPSPHYDAMGDDVTIEMSESLESNTYTVRSDLFLHGNILHNEDSEGMSVAAPASPASALVPDAELGILDAYYEAFFTH